MWKLWLTFARYSQKQLRPAGRTQNLSIVGDDKSQLVTEFTERRILVPVSVRYDYRLQ